jgi:hypothetical protein
VGKQGVCILERKIIDNISTAYGVNVKESSDLKFLKTEVKPVLIYAFMMVFVSYDLCMRVSKESEAISTRPEVRDPGNVTCVAPQEAFSASPAMSVEALR